MEKSTISVITETKLIIEKLNEKILESNKKYYSNVLDFLNMVFSINYHLGIQNNLKF